MTAHIMRFDWKNSLFRLYLKIFFSPDFSAAKSIDHQQKIFRKIIRQLAPTQLGKDLQLQDIKTYDEFRRKIPVTQYGFYESYIEKIKSGQKNVMTHEKVTWFAKTAGTTSGKSKLVPVTNQIMRRCHVRGSFFALSKIHQLAPELNLLGHKNLLIPGGIYETIPGTGISVGDISAILVRNVPWIYRSYYVPDIDVQTFPDWEKKIEKTVARILHEDVGTISGIPTWYLAILNKMMSLVPFQNLREVWNNLQVFFHGGVSFEPYRKQFETLAGKADFIFYEVYNATEGFFGIQETRKGGELLLLTDNSVFYEFIALADYGAGKMATINIEEVKTGVPYALLITAPNGLIRYMIGDVLTFSGTDPYTFRITGRTQEYINAFGEDLLLSNVENALMKANRNFKCEVNDYTVAPFYISIEAKGRIQFAIEFLKAPVDLQSYEAELDEKLQIENSNYKQKRANDLALTSLEVIALPPGSFYKWLSSKNKLGGQNKVPRLVNGRGVMDEILRLNDKPQ